MRKIAVVFPGQGSQCVGMLADLENTACVKETLRQADAVLGYPISDMIARGPESNGTHTAGARRDLCGDLSRTP